MMTRLLALKEWVTLDEAATFLSVALSEAVTHADLYRLALAGHLVLSAHFVNYAHAQIGTRRPIRETDFKTVPMPFEPTKSMTIITNGRHISDSEIIALGEDVVTIGGIWDLPMIGAEVLDIEQALQQATGGPDVTLTDISGTMVKHPADGTYALLQEPFTKGEGISRGRYSYFPSGGLPSDAPIVVRSTELLRFVSELGTPSTNDLPAITTGVADSKPLAARERNNLLRIIAALAKEAKIDISEGGGGAATIEAAVAAAKFDSPKEQAIRAVLKQIRELSQ